MNKQAQHTNEKNILAEATRELTAYTGVAIQILPPQGERMDGIVQVKAGKETYRFFVEVKNELREPTLKYIIEQFGREKEDWLLICRYIPQPLKQQLRTLAINYLETAGNCCIRAGNLFLYINDRKVTPARLPETGKLWKETGLRFLFVLLADQGLVNAPYRAIAQKACIALGNIGGLQEELIKEGYLDDGGGTARPLRRWTNKEQLITRWADMYYLTLRPKLVKGRYRFLRQAGRAWENTLPDGFLWGGEPAGALLTGYLRPETFTIFGSGTAPDLMKALQAVPDPAGNIEWLEPFWQDLPVTQACVPPLLVYADLINNTDGRLQETAERVKQQYLYDR